MEIRLVPVEEALRMAREGKVTDGPSALALLWCEPLLTQERQPCSEPQSRDFQYPSRPVVGAVSVF
jgi:hypothetical protein